MQVDMMGEGDLNGIQRRKIRITIRCGKANNTKISAYKGPTAKEIGNEEKVKDQE